eukprot:CAMPEP_0202712710 /NCGR_PEP_ID=MMETSP1385-20130828/44326_1 /ASSEMBLY_ACC=CAM_ASM_000861 /TAXON_ID=933848 /ORGANISM="Elphidium margaritaceum" /LENGTH=392 /DNA_ID=CAMNT_0049372817 /DNA_START=122 /DNA_END=1300 /DNA_ORIENTATION=-
MSRSQQSNESTTDICMKMNSMQILTPSESPESPSQCYVGTFEEWLMNFAYAQPDSMIGAGRQGVIHLAIDKFSGMPVASKHCKVTNEEEFQKVVNEYERMINIGILTGFGIFYNQSRRTLIYNMPLMEGPLTSDRKIDPVWETPDSALVALKQCIVEIAAQIYLMQKHHTVHLDIKPCNVMYSCTEHMFCVIDYGLMTELDAQTGETQLASYVGTVGWMAPEIQSGKVTHKADVFSLGLVALFLVNGRNVAKIPLDEKKLSALIAGYEQKYGDKKDRKKYYKQLAQTQLWFQEMEKLDLSAAVERSVAKHKQFGGDAGIVDLMKKMLATKASRRLSAEQILSHRCLQDWVMKDDDDDSFYISKRDGKGWKKVETYFPEYGPVSPVYDEYEYE